MTIGNRLMNLRKINKYTLDQVGSIIGATKQTMYKYEHDIVTNIPIEKIEQLAKLYNVKPSYLMGWEEDANDSIEPRTIAAHHDGDEWTEDEQKDIELFKELLRIKKNRKPGD